MSVRILHSFFFSCTFQEHPPCLFILFLLVWHILLAYGRNLKKVGEMMPPNMPCECSFYDKAVQPNDAGFLCPSCSQGFEWPQQCRRFPVALGPLASCFSFGKRTIYDPEAFHPGRPLLSQFWLFSLENFPSLPFPSNLAFSSSPSWPKFSLQLWISLRAFHSALLALYLIIPYPGSI